MLLNHLPSKECQDGNFVVRNLWEKSDQRVGLVLGLL